MSVRKEELIGLGDVRTKENYADETSEFTKLNRLIYKLNSNPNVTLP